MEVGVGVAVAMAALVGVGVDVLVGVGVGVWVGVDVGVGVAVSLPGFTMLIQSVEVCELLDDVWSAKPSGPVMVIAPTTYSP